MALAQAQETRSDVPSRKPRKASVQPTAALCADWPRRLNEENPAHKIFPSPALRASIVHGEETYRDRRQQSSHAERKAVYLHAGLS